MNIQKKPKSTFYIGLSSVIVGGILLYYLMTTRGDAGDFITVFGKLFAVGLIINGIYHIIKYDQYSQLEDVAFDIANNKLQFKDKTYPLDGAYLTLRYTRYKNLFRTTLWLEKDDEVVEIFKNVVFDIDEMANLLALIKPYRKSDICLAKAEFGKIKLFKDGFTYENREILYDEIEKFDTKLIEINSDYYLDIDIILKNGTHIENRLNGGIPEYAKALYASMQFDLGQEFEDEIVCPHKSKAGLYTLIIDLGIVGYILYDHSFVESGIMLILFVTTIYAMFFDFSYQYKLCQEMQKIHKEQKEKID